MRDRAGADLVRLGSDWREETMSRRAARKDNNHNEIALALEAAGCTVFDTSRLGLGFPDMVCALPDGRLWMVEVKQPGGKLTTDELQVIIWLVNDNYRVFTSPEQAVEAINAER